MAEERLQKVIANAGVTSRRKAETLITTGKVQVNGVVVRQLGTKVDDHDEVSVNGVPLTKEKKVYYLLYKPRGVISAVSDSKGRKTVADILKTVPQRVYPVGRLDYDVSGVLIMTNDGDFANLLMHPRYEVHKTYIAKIRHIPDIPAQIALHKGVMIGKRKTAPAKFSIISRDQAKNTAIVRLTIHEGMNHQVKNMFKAVGSEVLKLSRESVGPINHEGLLSGTYRPLTHHEVGVLKALANGERLPS